MATPEFINELVINTSDESWFVRKYSVKVVVKLAKNSKEVFISNDLHNLIAQQWKMSAQSKS